MEDRPRNVQPDLNRRRVPSPTKRSARWTLLFVGDHGRTVRIKHFKGLLYLVTVVLLAALGTAAGLYLVNRHTIAENRRLAAEVVSLRQEISALRYEKDVLTARLVLTEAELREQKPPVEEAAPDASQAEQPSDLKDAAAEGEPEETSGAAIEPASALASPVAAVTTALPETAAAEPTGANAAPDAAADKRPVSVEDLAVSHEPERSVFRVTFVLRKGDNRPESVSGHAFVVLKPEGESDSDRWVPMPWATFKSGEPNPPRRGQFFSIARFKPMKFETSGVSDPSRFGRLSVFVYDNRGELLLQQDFNIPEPGTIETG